MKISSPAVTVRPMRRKDSVAVVKMINELAGSKKLTKAFLQKYCFGHAKSFRGWVAVIDEKPIGIALTSDLPNLNVSKIDCTLHYLFVEKEWRSENIGRTLIAHAAHDGMKRGCGWFRVHTSPDNKRAQKLYRDVGFTQRSYRPIQFFIEGKALAQLAKKTK